MVTELESKDETLPTLARIEPTPWQRIEHHSRLLDRAVRMTQLADGKVAPVLALHASLAAITVSQPNGLGSVLAGDNVWFGRMAIAWVPLVTYVASSLMFLRQVAMIYIPTAPREEGAPHMGIHSRTSTTFRRGRSRSSRPGAPAARAWMRSNATSYDRHT